MSYRRENHRVNKEFDKDLNGNERGVDEHGGLMVDRGDTKSNNDRKRCNLKYSRTVSESPSSRRRRARTPAVQHRLSGARIIPRSFATGQLDVGGGSVKNSTGSTLGWGRGASREGERSHATYFSSSSPVHLGIDHLHRENSNVIPPPRPSLSWARGAASPSSSLMREPFSPFLCVRGADAAADTRLRQPQHHHRQSFHAGREGCCTGAGSSSLSYSSLPRFSTAQRHVYGGNSVTLGWQQQETAAAPAPQEYHTHFPDSSSSRVMHNRFFAHRRLQTAATRWTTRNQVMEALEANTRRRQELEAVLAQQFLNGASGENPTGGMFFASKRQQAHQEGMAASSMAARLETLPNTEFHQVQQTPIYSYSTIDGIAPFSSSYSPFIDSFQFIPSSRWTTPDAALLFPRNFLGDDRSTDMKDLSSFAPPSTMAGTAANITMGRNPRLFERWAYDPLLAETESYCHPLPKMKITDLLPLPYGAGDLRPLSQRVCVPMATDEDQNWLSEFLCFVRSDLVEFFRASEQDVRSRNSSKKVIHGQVGIRCRYCAHLPQSARAARSSSYPKTLSRIYQSLTMMLRDHFGACSCIPFSLKQRFQQFKDKTSQGATGSNSFWEYSARKIGMKDSEFGIWIDEQADVDGRKDETFGSTGDIQGRDDDNITAMRAARATLTQTTVQSQKCLVTQDDGVLVSEFLFTLMSTHAQLIFLEESERIGNRKNLHVGLAGIGCKHCCHNNRMGLCRLFPARRRTLPSKVNDLFDHVCRCTLCPKERRDRLVVLKTLEGPKDRARVIMEEKEFYDRIWARMGYGRSDS